jgi:hypothetical protein
LDDEDEKRSVKAEIDYTFKDAARHIVADKNKKNYLRDRIMKNLDSIKNGKVLSERSYKSTQSRFTDKSAR